MFQTRLKELREAAGYKSQQALADALGTSQSTVGNWESGRRNPRHKTAIRLAQFFGVSVDYLLGLEEKTEKPASVSADGQAEKLAKALGGIGIDVEALSDSEINRIAKLAKVALEE